MELFIHEIHATVCLLLLFKATRNDVNQWSLINLDFVTPASCAAMFAPTQKNAKTIFRPIAHLAPEAFEGTIWNFTRQMAKLTISN